MNGVGRAELKFLCDARAMCCPSDLQLLPLACLFCPGLLLVRPFPAPPVISLPSNPESLTQGGSCGSGKQGDGQPALIQQENEK